MSKDYITQSNKNEDAVKNIVSDILKLKILETISVQRIFHKYTDENKKILSKSIALKLFKKLIENKKIQTGASEIKKIENVFKMKKIRTISGVIPVTVLTMPFPCPGKCIFCPNDVRMPKSYISSEPGAQRAETNKFDPYLQTYNRLVALKNMGHPTDKVEIIILGGTWSVYPEEYQIWFVKRCFDALNDFSKKDVVEILKSKEGLPFDENLLEKVQGEFFKKTYNQIVAKAIYKELTKNKMTATWEELFQSQKTNENAKSRCVGLSLETRPDEISKEELFRIRKLGATKIQIGVQSLNDSVLKKNKRGHTSKQTSDAVNMIRLAGFKIHAHAMANLYGSTPEEDKKDFKKLFLQYGIFPDELKVYPCSLIETAELMKYYKKGLWKPYSKTELLNVLESVYMTTPRFTRLTRVIRDIPSNEIVDGNKLTNFRQVIEKHLLEKGVKINEIRSREIKDRIISRNELSLLVTKYETEVSHEYFIEFITKNDQIASFLRLSLPKEDKYVFEELKNHAIIREVHVYGQSLAIGEKDDVITQHMGLGKEMISKAEQLSRNEEFSKIAVISSIGTREYYEKLGYLQSVDELYQHKSL